MSTSRRELLYTGKSKQVWSTDDPDLVVVAFQDDATAFNGQKHAKITDKARANAAISAHLLGVVGEAGVRHHLVEVLGPTEQLCRRLSVIPVEVVVRNRVAGSLAKRYGLDEGATLPFPLVELFYKSDALGDPLASEDVAAALGWAQRDELSAMREDALAVNEALQEHFTARGISLVDFKLEFGRDRLGGLWLCDEITPDGCRLWDAATGARLDKDVFRRDLGDLSETYRALHLRLLGRPLEA
jgi:phosphoribosylaminoimidazole-succinocarboxamide synthase